MNDNVIAFGSRKPLAQHEADEEAAAIAIEQAQEKRASEHQELCLKTLDRLKELVSEGRLSGLMIIGRDPESKLFLTETVLDATVTPVGEMFAYVGVVETLKAELVEYASMAPALLTDGTVADPWAEPDEEEYAE
ncbi:MAG: hypothetical protein DI537_13850 [Stutzerimonas stutzeri]|nr:MAG: hypothetical protein DI537_13850 [Stutzerimonas stutzeri]